MSSSVDQSIIGRRTFLETMGIGAGAGGAAMGLAGHIYDSDAAAKKKQTHSARLSVDKLEADFGKNLTEDQYTKAKKVYTKLLEELDSIALNGKIINFLETTGCGMALTSLAYVHEKFKDKNLEPRQVLEILEKSQYTRRELGATALKSLFAGGAAALGFDRWLNLDHSYQYTEAELETKMQELGGKLDEINLEEPLLEGKNVERLSTVFPTFMIVVSAVSFLSIPRIISTLNDYNSLANRHSIVAGNSGITLKPIKRFRAFEHYIPDSSRDGRSLKLSMEMKPEQKQGFGRYYDLDLHFDDGGEIVLERASYSDSSHEDSAASVVPIQPASSFEMPDMREVKEFSVKTVL